jgi:type III polyketide synthase
MNLTPEHMRASYEIYINHGNSSSATIFSVMDRLRKVGPGKENVVGCAFGPGIAIEMMMFRRIAGMDSWSVTPEGILTPEEMLEAEPLD